MIIDVHSHFFRDHSHFSESFVAQSSRSRTEPVDLRVRWEDYLASAPADTRTIVFGAKARLSGQWVEDEVVAEYAAAHPEHLIGFMALDPTQPGWQDEMRVAHRSLGLRGIKLMPMYAGFDPGDEMCDPLWAYAQEHQLPVLLHTGTTFVAQAPIAYARPALLDPVATRFPELRMILAHLGHPYEGECIAVIRKHPHVYADVSALVYRPFQLWRALMLVQEYGVWDKILFGTDFPFTTVNESVDGLRAVAAVESPKGLHGIDAAAVESVIFRDSLPLLGLT